jgi:hypothetical protein
LCYTYHCGCYGSLTAFRDSLRDVREGRKSIAELEGAEGFHLSVSEHPIAGGCVQGSIIFPISRTVESFQNSEAVGNALAKSDSTTAYRFQFAFKTSIVDPPHLDSFINDLNQLLTYLEQSAI